MLNVIRARHTDDSHGSQHIPDELETTCRGSELVQASRAPSPMASQPQRVYSVISVPIRNRAGEFLPTGDDRSSLNPQKRKATRAALRARSAFGRQNRTICCVPGRNHHHTRRLRRSGLAQTPDSTGCATALMAITFFKMRSGWLIAGVLDMAVSSQDSHGHREDIKSMAPQIAKMQLPCQSSALRSCAAYRQMNQDARCRQSMRRVIP